MILKEKQQNNFDEYNIQIYYIKYWVLLILSI